MITFNICNRRKSRVNLTTGKLPYTDIRTDGTSGAASGKLETSHATKTDL